MATTLTSSPFSIVNFFNTSAANKPEWSNEYFNCGFANENLMNCLGLYGFDLQFQFVIDFDSDAEAIAYLMDPTTIEIGTIYIDESSINLIDEGSIDRIYLGANRVLILIKGPITFTNIDYNHCFIFSVSDPDENYNLGQYFSRTCFFHLQEENDLMRCENTLIRYRNKENSFGFIYCRPIEAGPDIYNYVRLPFNVSRPQYPETKNIFQYADGSQKIVDSVIKKTLQLDTDYMSAEWHEVLKIALSHDDVTIFPGVINFIGSPADYDHALGIVPEDDYNIQWHDRVRQLRAPAQTRVSITPFAAINPNCDNCLAPPCSITTDPVSPLVFDQPGDPVFYSEGVIVFDINDYFDFTVENCPSGIEFALEGLASFDVDSVVVTPEGEITVTMNTLAPGTYLIDQELFSIRALCPDSECPTVITFIGTISEENCPVPEPLSIDTVFPYDFTFSWAGPPTFAPEPNGGYRLTLYSAAQPLPAGGYSEVIPATGLSLYEVELDLYDLALDDPGDWTARLTAICDGEDGAFTEEEFTLEAPDYTPIENACFGPLEADACSCGDPATVYIPLPAVDFNVLVFCYLDASMTIPVPDGYIARPGGVIYQITGGAGQITFSTGNLC